MSSAEGRGVTMSGGSLPSMYTRVDAAMPMNSQGARDIEIDRNRNNHKNASINSYLDYSGVYANQNQDDIDGEAQANMIYGDVLNPCP